MKLKIKLFVLFVVLVVMSTGCMPILGIDTKEDAKVASEKISSLDNELLGMFTKAYLKYQIDPVSLADDEWNLLYKMYLYTDSLPEEGERELNPIDVLALLPVLLEQEVDMSGLAEFKEMSYDNWDAYFAYLGEPVG